MDMQVPSALNLHCAKCGQEGLHDVVRGRWGKKGNSLECTVVCKACGATYKTTAELERNIRVPLIISHMETSRKETLDLDESEELQVGQELFFEDERLEITAIETGPRRVRSAPASNIDTLWAKRINTIRVKVSIVHRNLTRTADMWLDPDDTISVGEILELSGRPCEVTSMRIEGKNLRKGSAAARDIRRVYTREKSDPKRRRPGGQGRVRGPSNRSFNRSSGRPSGRPPNRPSGRYSNRNSNRPSGRSNGNSYDRPSRGPSRRNRDTRGDR